MMRFIVLILGMFCIAGCTREGASQYFDSEEEALVEILKAFRQDDGYVIVNPKFLKASFAWDCRGNSEIKNEFIAEVKGFAVGSDILFLRCQRLSIAKQKDGALQLTSSPEEGYVVNDGSYRGSWQDLYSKYPKAQGFLSISDPIIDLELGFALVFVQRSTGSLGGYAGWRLIKFTKSGCKFVWRCNFWVS